mmetsp:Transcript_95343/g.253286  ORF Transcript_95343/g.253286 Transcript_95343/m.253286 type:complete len:229 (-) Transcript_95343:15-701(-)
MSEEGDVPVWEWRHRTRDEGVHELHNVIQIRRLPVQRTVVLAEGNLRDHVGVQLPEELGDVRGLALGDPAPEHAEEILHDGADRRQVAFDGFSVEAWRDQTPLGAPLAAFCEEDSYLLVHQADVAVAVRPRDLEGPPCQDWLARLPIAERDHPLPDHAELEDALLLAVLARPLLERLDKAVCVHLVQHSDHRQPWDLRELPERRPPPQAPQVPERRASCERRQGARLR